VVPERFHLTGWAGSVNQALPGLLTASVTVLTAMSDICNWIWREWHVAFRWGNVMLDVLVVLFILMIVIQVISHLLEDQPRRHGH
jgi:hypothetical protein